MIKLTFYKLRMTNFGTEWCHLFAIKETEFRFNGRRDNLVPYKTRVVKFLFPLAS
ncbi:hypothetical protein SAMN05216334_10450 [Nitrosomonas ureae]|uniref:Uncharacterized protein n=1 Tax=Nitrosomonas ureae TaxID=44577 RepID=A0A1H5T897_9PROT|nr:hypothetical protein SAMN05216334_10450 [Nitrosomonas ureae]